MCVLHRYKQTCTHSYYHVCVWSRNLYISIHTDIHKISTCLSNHSTLHIHAPKPLLIHIIMCVWSRNLRISTHPGIHRLCPFFLSCVCVCVCVCGATQPLHIHAYRHLCTQTSPHSYYHVCVCVCGHATSTYPYIQTNIDYLHVFRITQPTTYPVYIIFVVILFVESFSSPFFS